MQASNQHISAFDMTSLAISVENAIDRFLEGARKAALKGDTKIVFFHPLFKMVHGAILREEDNQIPKRIKDAFNEFQEFLTKNEYYLGHHDSQNFLIRWQ